MNICCAWWRHQMKNFRCDLISYPLLKYWLKLFAKHDDAIKWKHLPRNWPFVRGIHHSPVISPHKGQWRGALMFSLMFAWINGCVNNREAGDLRRHRAHYDVIVIDHGMLQTINIGLYLNIKSVAKKLQAMWRHLATMGKLINVFTHCFEPDFCGLL